jgi:hypothetical protein
MDRKGLTAIVREQMRILGVGGREINYQELAKCCDLVFNVDKQYMYGVLKNMRKTGEIERVRRGVCVYKGKDKPHLHEIMWRFLRARKVVTIDDLREIAGASRNYATEWMRMLQKHELVKVIRTGNLRKYQLISDQVAVPQNDEKAKKFRRARRQKKREALACLRLNIGTCLEVLERHRRLS